MKDYQKAIRFLSVMALSCVLAVFGGNFIDQFFHTTPLFLLILLFYAIGGNLYKLLKDTGDES